MNYRKRRVGILVMVLSLLGIVSCHDTHSKDGTEDKKAAPVVIKGGTDIRSMLQYAADNKDQLNDTTTFNYRGLMDSVYEANNFTPLWSDRQHWRAPGDSLFDFIVNSRNYGLFPSDYHFTALAFIRRVIEEDTVARKNALFWARADLMLTDAFFTLVKHLKQGRLPYDSVTLRKDSVLSDTLFTKTLSSVLQSGAVGLSLHALEPKFKGYDSLKAYIGDFLATAHLRKLTWIDYPNKDSAALHHSLFRRLQEVGYIDSAAVDADTAGMAGAIRAYQKANKMKVTGKISDDLVTMMNNSDWEKFKRIAITLDRYKLLPDTLPNVFVWVNLPSFTLQVVDSDTVVMESRVIVGAPKTRTPLLTSEISNFITFPQWTVPVSIIMKEMLPAIKNNIDYLRKQNLMVVDDNDSVRDPTKINWRRLNKNNFPYQIKQRQGDDNSLGVMKFNFRNKYDVYLHDTNVRWMFDKSFRALSHGCVRVKEWRKLSDFLIRNDTMRYHPDTLRAWIKRQEKHTIYGFARVPIFLRYFTCEGKKGKILFHDDIYFEDRELRNRYFANKPII